MFGIHFYPVIREILEKTEPKTYGGSPPSSSQKDGAGPAAAEELGA